MDAMKKIHEDREAVYQLISPQLKEIINGFQGSIHTGTEEERAGPHDETRIKERDQ